MPSEKRDRLREALEEALCIGGLEYSSTEWLRGGAIIIAHAIINGERPAIDGLDPRAFEWEDCESAENALYEVLDVFFALAGAAQILAHKDSAFSSDEPLFHDGPLWDGGPSIKELAKCNSVEKKEATNA